MSKYTTNKSNSLTKKQNIFKRYNFLKGEIAQTKKNIKSLEKIKLNKPSYEVNNIEEQIYEQKKYLERLNKSRSNLKKRFVKLAATIGVLLTVATSSYGAYKSDKDFDENFIDANQVLQMSNETEDRVIQSDDILYEQLKIDIQNYTNLSKKENLTREEKQQMDNAKRRINANPEGITRLSLDILKQKIANSIGAEDYSKIIITDNSTQVSADKYHNESGSKTDIAIFFDGNTIGTVEKFQSLATGQINITNDTIPKEVLKVIDKIVHSQLDPQDTKKATKALKASLNLNEKELSFDNEKANELNEER